jgi:AAA domain/RepB DNA-primase N-terminal domain
VFLPWIEGGANSAEERKRGFHEGPAYSWPGDEAKIVEYLKSHDTDDVYFTPSLFEIPLRQNETAVAERALWADLDEASPDIAEWRPSIAWETSPDRYQGIWLLDHPLVGASWAGRENQRLTTHVGADPSGWDTTQLLRVPGRRNHKVEYRKRRVVGRLLWTDGPRYKLEDLDSLPEITVTDAERQADLLDEDLLRGVDRRAVWTRVRLKVSKQVREYMAYKGRDVEAGEADRSEVLWQIDRDLADAGCTLAEIVALVRASAWNKYRGRADELKRLKIEAARAIAETKKDGGDPGGALEVVEDVDRPTPDTLTALMSGRRQRPKWLVNNVWSVGGVGFTAGQPKMYKSWVALDMALSVATGRPFLGDAQFHTPDGGVPVLYVQEEDSEMSVVNHAESVVMGRDPELHPMGVVEIDEGGVWWRPGVGSLDNFHVYVRKGFKISDEAWQSWLDDTLDELKIQMVIIDTLGTTAGEVDTDKASDLTHKILRPLRTLAAKHGTAVNVVHHNKKTTDGGRAGQQLLGSVALHAWVEDALYLREKNAWRDGYEIKVERESKAAPDLRFNIRVPRFGLRYEHDGIGRGRAAAGFRSSEMTWWTPEVVVNVDDDAGTETVLPTPQEKRASGQRQAGDSIAWKIAKTGGKHGVTIDNLAATFSIPRSSVVDQIEKAIASGAITQKPNGLYVAAKKMG